MKLDLFAKAKWYAGRGLPPSYIAEKLGVSRTTVWSWLQLMDHDRAVKELRRRVLMLPERHRDQIATAIADARRAA
jgi:DNA-binding GntR family transcriptional regulator